MNKLKDVLGSKNFLVSLISIVLLGFSSNSIDVGYTSEGLYSLFNGKAGNELITTGILFAFNSGFKIYLSIKEKGFSFAFLKSSNFVAAFISVISVVIGGVLNEPLSGIAIALATQVVNLVYHLFLPPKEVAQILPITDEMLLPPKTKD